eukprot:CAMPEP_0201100366 /NCGR_PEP_ID=MMETSP0812-20130820/9243_1 /ASSEMBLY_ACC=CAM_ASM_000668 /TAXON_ID=98059 /ORGANISM="Dinobryon sp., Strain UTEXLB2267" /LENGTH=118 /DNA_ID=CAMNT_0047356679 /DNA_START=2629 /DNA_END=2985 /DNA_ORIENTATION=+
MTAAYAPLFQLRNPVRIRRRNPATASKEGTVAVTINNNASSKPVILPTVQPTHHTYLLLDAVNSIFLETFNADNVLNSIVTALHKSTFPAVDDSYLASFQANIWLTHMSPEDATNFAD